MVKSTQVFVRLTTEQHKQLKEKATSEGFIKVSEYVRYKLFMQNSIEKKIDLIFDKVMKIE